MSWAEKLQERVKGVAYYGPKENANPAPGEWTVVGPTGKQMGSTVSIDRAAFMFLVHFVRDDEAREALKKEQGTA
jgi:hypothetical protein